jgi:hypothetical protein
MSNIEKRGRILLHHKYPEELAPLSFFYTFYSKANLVISVVLFQEQI